MQRLVAIAMCVLLLVGNALALDCCCKPKPTKTAAASCCSEKQDQHSKPSPCDPAKKDCYCGNISSATPPKEASATPDASSLVFDFLPVSSEIGVWLRPFDSRESLLASSHSPPKTPTLLPLRI